MSDCYHRKPFLKGIFRGTEKSACLIAKEEDRYALNVMIMTKQAFNEERSNPLNLQKRYAHTNASWVVCRLKTLIDQGCKVYPDTSSHLRSGDGHPFIITLPKTTKTNVEIYPINEESSSKPNKAVLNSPKETDTNKMFSSNRKENEALSSHSTNLNRDLENVDYRQCNVFKIKQTNHENTSEKIWAQETGYINNLKNTGEPALLIHHLDGLFSIEAEGTALNVNDFFEFMRNKYPNLMKKIETDKKPLHLIACYMKDSIAQEIANKLNRTVIIYGDPEKELKSSLKSTTDSYYTFSSLYKKKSQFFNETQVIDTKGVVKIKSSIAKARAIFPKENELEKKLKSPEYQKLVQDRWNRTDMLQKKSESATTAYSASFSHNNTASTSTTAFQNSPPNQIFSEQKSALGANAKDIRPSILDQLVKTKDIGDFLEMTKKMLDTVAPEEFKRIFSEPAVVNQCRYFWDKSSLAMGDKAKILKLPSEISQGAESSQVENMVIGLKNKIQEAIQTLGEVKTRDTASQKMLDAQRKAEQKHDTEMKKRQIEREIESQQNLLAFSQDNHIRRLQSQETKIQQDFQTQQEKKTESMKYHEKREQEAKTIESRMVHNAIQNEQQSHKDKLALEQASRKRSEDTQKLNARDKNPPALKDFNRNPSSSQDEPGNNSPLNRDHGNRLEASSEQNSSIKPLSSNDEIRNLLRQAKVTKGEDDNLHLELDVKIPHKNNDTNDNATLSLDVSMGQTKTVFYKNDAPPTFGSRVPETQKKARTSTTLLGLHTSTSGVGIHIKNSSGSEIKSALPSDSFDNLKLQNHDSGQTTFISTGSFPNKSAPKSIKN